MDAQLRKKVEEIIGEIKSVVLLDEQGCTSLVRKILTHNGTYLMKSSFKKRYREWLKQEAEVLKELKSAHIIPVPQYYGYIEEQEGSHVIMSFEQGISLTSALNNAKSLEEKKSLISSFGQFLNKLHEINLIDSLNTNNHWIDHQLMRAEQYFNLGDTDGTIELVNQLKTSKPESVKQTMIHGDCTTDNILVVDGVVNLFIDVSGVTVGDPRYDESLAIRKFVRNEEFIKAFYAGYTRYKVSIEEYQFFNEGLYEFF